MFFEKIYGDTSGLVDIVTVEMDGKPSSERWFRYPEDLEHIYSYVGMRANEDVFCSTSVFTEPRRTNADTGATAYSVGVDADTCHPDNFRLPPSARVRTGEDRWQCWWFLDEAVPAHEAAQAAKRISTAHVAQGCDKPHTHHVSKILRVPGSTNSKHVNEDDLMWSVEIEYSGEVYTLDTINAVYDDVALGSLAAKQEATVTSASEFDESLFSLDELQRLQNYAESAWEADLHSLEAAGPGNYHNLGYQVACNLYRNANVKWSTHTHKEAEKAVQDALEGHDAQDTQRVLKDARRDVGSDSLALPAWALDLLPDTPPDPITGQGFQDLEERIVSAGLRSDFTKALKEGETATDRTLELSKSLFRTGLNARQVFSLMLKASANTNKNKRPRASVWADVQHAMGLADFAQTSKEVTFEFLEDNEREYLEAEPCFIDRYVAWVASRTNSATTYSQSLAWILLSSLYSDRGFLPLQWGPKTPLNLWLLVLGSTTNSRKSTALNFFLRVLHEVEGMASEKLDIGSNTTAEAIVKELGKRDGLTSVMHTDEVNGFFRNVYTKNYASGTLETFTDLYGGNVPVTLRATQGSGNSTRARTQFIFVGVGIRDETAEVLTQRNFASGFLPRMLWSVADAPDVPAGDAVVFFSGDSSYDETMNGLIDELAFGRNKYHPENKQPVTADAAALKRINVWAADLSSKVSQYGDVEVLSPSVARLTDSVLKAAALLALHEGSKQITLRHMLFALRQAESWFRDLVRMAGEVSSSEFERKLATVEEYIFSGADNARTDMDVRKKFSRYKPLEMDEVMRALSSQGRIRRFPDDAKKWQALA